MRRNRRRYGGYIVHVGIVVLFVGVAASSCFKDVRDVALSPGQSARVGGYEFTYVKPIAELHAAPNGRLERISLGAAAARGDGRQAAAHLEGLLPVAGPGARARSRASSTASRRPRSALDASLRKDIWAAVGPDIAKLRPRLDEGDRLFAKAARRPHRRAVQRVPRRSRCAG